MHSGIAKLQNCILWFKTFGNFCPMWVCWCNGSPFLFMKYVHHPQLKDEHYVYMHPWLFVKLLFKEPCRWQVHCHVIHMPTYINLPSTYLKRWHIICQVFFDIVWRVFIAASSLLIFLTCKTFSANYFLCHSAYSS